VPGFEATCYIAYSDANRSALIRIPAIRGKATRTDIRSVDPSANPYLAMTVILASGLDGIVHQMNSVKPVSINLYEVSEDEREKMGILSLPQTLNEAIYELEHDQVIKDALGPHVFSRYIAAKKEEWKNYSKSVTQWELDHYLNRY